MPLYPKYVQFKCFLLPVLKISEILDYDFSEFFRLNQTKSNQINFDINTEKAKVLVELSINKEDIGKLNIRDKVLHLFDT